jgi:NADPH2:quinone reductase
MRAWLLDSTTGLSALRLATLGDPLPKPGHAVLALRYASLNPADRYLAEGQYPAKPAFPHILGRDGVGTIVALGTQTPGVSVGQTKIIIRGEAGVSQHGTFAQLVSVPVDVLADLPPGWTEQQGAGAPLVYLTAYQALTQFEPLEPGSVVLVTGASGGVGIASLQLAKAMRLVPVGLSRDPGKHAVLRDNGARLALSPDDPTWRDQLYTALGRRPVALAIDNIGGSGFETLIDTLRQNGRVSVVGRLAGPVPQFNTSSLFFRRLRIGGVAVGTYTPKEAQAAWSALVPLLHSAGFTPHVDSVHPFDDLLTAFDRLAKGPLGKVLLEIPA